MDGDYGWRLVAYLIVFDMSKVIGLMGMII
jgi:hypothetical protein